uniref:Uncharacterized protein n=1 Tax=Ditylenchus dipsaci TaxID=166011 RepID=A0A915E5T5_9BILA
MLATNSHHNHISSLPEHLSLHILLYDPMSHDRSSTNLGWMQNSSDHIEAVNNAGKSHLIVLTNPLRSSFSASQNSLFTQMHSGSAAFNSSDGKNLSNEQFKVPETRPLGMSHSRLSLKNLSGGEMEVESASLFGSSVNGCVRKESPKYVVPARFNSSLCGKDLTGSMNGSINSTSRAPNPKFTSSFSMGSGRVTSVSRFDNYASSSQEQSVRSAMSVANSFHGSAGSSKGFGRSQFVRRANKSALIGSGLADLNSCVPSLSSFGQSKPDYLSLEAAKKKFHNLRR